MLFFINIWFVWPEKVIVLSIGTETVIFSLWHDNMMMTYNNVTYRTYIMVDDVLIILYYEAAFAISCHRRRTVPDGRHDDMVYCLPSYNIIYLSIMIQYTYDWPIFLQPSFDFDRNYIVAVVVESCYIIQRACVSARRLTTTECRPSNHKKKKKQQADERNIIIGRQPVYKASESDCLVHMRLQLLLILLLHNVFGFAKQLCFKETKV